MYSLLRTTVAFLFITAFALGSLAPAAASSLAPHDLESAFDEMDDMRERGEFQEALAWLNELEREHPNHPEIYWRRAWAHIDLGTGEDIDSERERLFSAALEEAQTALEIDDESSMAHLAIAVAAGRLGAQADTRERLERSRQVKEHVERALELDPELAPAYHVRARWHHEVASLGFVARAVVETVYGGLPDASTEAAVADFERSIELDERIVDRLELGRLFKEEGDTYKAQTELEKALDVPKKGPHDDRYRQEAEELLASL